MHKAFWQEKSVFGSDTPDSVTVTFGGISGQDCGEDRCLAENIPQPEETDRQIQNDLLSLAKTPQGRRFLKYLLEAAGVFESMPVANQAMYAYCEGRRSMGLMLYHRLYALGPQYLIQIQGEQ